MPGLFRAHVQRRDPDPNDARRPSHWHEDQNERDVPPLADYPTDVVEEPVIGFVPPANPVPVYLTEPPPNDRALRQWAPQSMTVGTDRVQLCGSDRRRTRMMITNNDTDATVYLLRREDDLLINGYPLMPGKDVELRHNDQVWAVASGGDVSAPLGWFAEFELEES